MANNCYHFLTFSGSKQETKEVFALFGALALLCSKTNEGQRPSDLGEDAEYMFDISIEGDQINYWCKWSHNGKDIHDIMTRLGVKNYEVDYEETSLGLYGRSGAIDGVKYDVVLDEKDLARVEYIEEHDTYYLDGAQIESETGAYWDMLDEKCLLAKPITYELIKTVRRSNYYMYEVKDSTGKVISSRLSAREYVAATVDGSYYFGRLDLIGKGDHGRHIKWSREKGVAPKQIAYLKQ